MLYNCLISIGTYKDRITQLEETSILDSLINNYMYCPDLKRYSQGLRTLGSLVSADPTFMADKLISYSEACLAAQQ